MDVPRLYSDAFHISSHNASLGNKAVSRPNCKCFSRRIYPIDRLAENHRIA
jgi:hypothetical protein